jgi:hypothetical protein
LIQELSKTLELSKLWEKYEISWGFKVPQVVRQHYEDLCISPDVKVKDLENDLDRMTEMVILAYSKGTGGSKKARQHKTRRMKPLMKNIEFAKKVEKALIDIGQDPFPEPGKNKHWEPVVEKLNADYPHESWDPRETGKDWSRAMKDTAVASSASAWAVAYMGKQNIVVPGSPDIILRRGVEKQLLDDDSTVSFQINTKGKGNFPKIGGRQ